MPDITEQVARAIYEARGGTWPPIKLFREDVDRSARAAIAAVRAADREAGMVLVRRDDVSDAIECVRDVAAEYARPGALSYDDLAERLRAALEEEQ